MLCLGLKGLNEPRMSTLSLSLGRAFHSRMVHLQKEELPRVQKCAQFYRLFSWPRDFTIYILANTWKSEIRTFSSFWPSERQRRKCLLEGSGGMPPQNIIEFYLSTIAENGPNLLTLIKSVHRFQQIDCTLQQCVYSYS